MKRTTSAFLVLLLVCVPMLVFAVPRVAAANDGDLNGDGMVDIQDVAIVAIAFGSYPGHPRWNVCAEQIGDNIIDVRDVSFVAANFGKMYAP